MENCKNCNEIITGNYCSNCGQKRYSRIDKKYIWGEIQSALLNTDKGFFYSIKNILRNPGKTAREFIEGNRVKHYKPIFLAFVLSGFSAFISYKVMNLNEATGEALSQQNMSSDFSTDMMTWISNYNSILMLLMLPLFALVTKIPFKKWGNNYYEHIVMNAYFLSFYTLLSIVLIYPIIFIWEQSGDSVLYSTLLTFLLVPFLLVWFFKGFYNDKPLKSIIIKIIGSLGLVALGYLMIVICGAIFSIVYGMVNGPESLEYLKPQ